MISYEQTLADLRKIAADKKAANGGVDYVYAKAHEDQPIEGYPVCLYAHKVNGSFTPGCIIGVLLVTVHGVSLERLNELQFSMYDGRAAILVRELGLDFSDEAIDLLRDVQSAQDSGTAWTEAVKVGALSVGDLAAEG